MTLIAMVTLCLMATVFMTTHCQGIIRSYHRAQDFEGNIDTSLSLIESTLDLTPLECVRKCYRDSECYSLILQDDGKCALHYDYMRIYNATGVPGLSYFYFERGSCEESMGLLFIPSEKFCFKIIFGSYPFAGSQDICASEGLSLATPNTEGKIDVVAEHLRKKGYGGLYMHTGLTYNGTEWTWGNKTVATDVKWKTNQPSSDPLSKPCGNLFYWIDSANFYSLVCTTAGSVLCEKML